MTARVLPRDYGVVVECNRCGAKEQTAITGKRRNRAFAKAKGWGRGTDRGTTGRHPAPGRPKTLGHDLCPACLVLDLDAADARRTATIARRAARNAK